MVRIIPYNPSHRKAFKALNESWIQQYFKMEETDIRSLGDPQSYILDKGGAILVALEAKEVIGVCALIPTQDPRTMELAKMAVTPKARGKKVGYKLGQAVLELAKEKGASTVYLESNTLLTPAIQLYRKLGFKEVTGRPSPYERCNIQMERLLY